MGILCQCSVNLTRRRYFLLFRTESPMCQFVSTAFLLSLAPLKRTRVSHLDSLPPRYLYILMRSTWAFPRLNSSSSLSLSSYERLACLLAILVSLHWTCYCKFFFFLYRGACWVDTGQHLSTTQVLDYPSTSGERERIGRAKAGKQLTSWDKEFNKWKKGGVGGIIWRNYSIILFFNKIHK